MNEVEDTTVLFIAIAKDSIGQEILRSGIDVESEEETEHYATMTLYAKEYYSIDELLLSMIKPCNVFIDAGELSIMNKNYVKKGKEMTLQFLKEHPETKTACDKMVKMLDIALRNGCDIRFS